jgi:outer membrane protein assembly factor BamA
LKQTLGAERLLVTVAPYYLLDLLGVTSNRLLREEVGVRGEVRKELTEITDRLFVTLGVQAKVIATWSDLSNSPIIDGERLFSPRRTLGKIYIDGAFDRRDSPLNPRSGYFLQFRPQLVSGDTLQGTAGDALRDSFWRLTFNASLFLPLGNRVVLAQGVRYGHIVPLANRQIPVTEDERYLLGGVGSLRGLPESGLLSTYDPNSAAPQLIGGEFVLNYSAELRYPLVERLGVHGAMFMDAGVLTGCFDERTGDRVSCWRDAFPSDAPLSTVRSSVGMGLRYLVLEQIPLLLDYAVLLNRRPGEAFSNVHFNIGYSF